MSIILGSCHCNGVRWEYEGSESSATSCNCTLCRRYGAIWIYGYEGIDIKLFGDTRAYKRDRGINGYHFCPNCGSLCYYKASSKDSRDRFRVALNLRMVVNLAQVENFPIDLIDGLESFEDLPADGRRVADLIQ